MSDPTFFTSPKKVSEVKSNIVLKYFVRWSKVIVATLKKYQKGNKIAYIDMFCGPGEYDDGSESTPIRILKVAIDNEDLQEMLVTMFNDKNSHFIDRLKNAVDKISNVKKLKFEPIFENEAVGDKTIKEFYESNIIPSFIFIDPWGYKGLSTDLIAAVVKDWGCDCLMFFNYNRINAAINNKYMVKNINQLFGETRAKLLRASIIGLKSRQREQIVIKNFYEALNEKLNVYPVHFKFFSEKGKTSHFLIFVSKNQLGYKLMKDVMHEESQEIIDDVANFSFDPLLLGRNISSGLFSPIEDLEHDLKSQYKGLSLSMNEIYQKHNLGTPYIEKNYKKALLNLELKGHINCTPPYDKRPKRNGCPTMGDQVQVNFK
jgi:three-Cys-motif partner protein